MPFYMDRHNLPGVTTEQVARAHELDMAVQSKHGVNYMKYWCDETRGCIYCLVEAPDKESAVEVHRAAHGLLADEIIEVDPAVVEAFLGVIPELHPSAPPAAVEAADDTAFRTILFTDLKDSTAITGQLGDERAMELIRSHNRIVREALKAHQGREVKHTGDGVMASFASASRAVQAAMAMQQGFQAHNEGGPVVPLQVRIGLSAGEPVAEDRDLYGAAVQLAARLCAHARPQQILVSGVIYELCMGKRLPFRDLGTVALKGFERPVQVYELAWPPQ
jgi:class 3 adenylate cyclase